MVIPRCVQTPSLALLLSDAFAIIVSSLLALLWREVTGGDIHWSLYVPVIPRLCIFPLLYAASGLYPATFMRRFEELRRLSIATAMGFTILALTFFLSKEGDSFSRAALVGAWILATILVPLIRSLLRARCSILQRWANALVIFGQGPSLMPLLAALQKNAPRGIAPVALVLSPGTQPPEKGLLPDSVEVLYADPFADDVAATLSDLAGRHPGAQALLLLPGYSSKEQEQWLDVTEQHFSRILLIPKPIPGERGWDMAAHIGRIPGLVLRQNLLDARRLRMKRALDIALTVCSSVVMLPLLGLLMVLVRLDSKGPALFKHERIGHNGRRFMAYKFRTMAENAQELLDTYLAANPGLRQEWEETQKLKNDPRITRIGLFLRKSSLDELPQLINVLKGEMSLVGPRPIVEAEIAKYGKAYELYTQVRPGITGLWQVSGRSDTSYDERVSLDRYYISNWSVWLDIHIICRTIPEVLWAKGAY